MPVACSLDLCHMSGRTIGGAEFLGGVRENLSYKFWTSSQGFNSQESKNRDRASRIYP